ncbi:MAG: hypothetical protein R2788_11065 [Saprospiraceae bacterium]
MKLVLHFTNGGTFTLATTLINKEVTNTVQHQCRCWDFCTNGRLFLINSQTLTTEINGCEWQYFHQ